MFDVSDLKLGKREPKHDPRTVRLSDYVVGALPPPPPRVNWGTRARRLGMMLNDRIGDCGIAAPAHLVQCWTAENGSEIVVPDAEILAAYQAVSGYVPGRPDTDNGVFLLDVMKYWRNVGIGGHKIAAFAAVDLRDRMALCRAIAFFGGVVAGFALPQSSQSQPVWSLKLGGTVGSPRRYSWGGHAVSIHGYTLDDDETLGDVECVTWGERKLVTLDFCDGYCDEAYVAVSQDWADADGAPSGYDLNRLLADVRSLS